MGRILIRNLDDAVLDALRLRAAQAGMSLEEVARRALAEAVGARKEAALRNLDAIRRRIGRLPGESSVETLRRDRARDEDKDAWRSS
jgi:plasmid stability protein